MSLSSTNLTFTYFEDRKGILEDLTVSFPRDRITVLTGASGCGKSTLLYILAGIYPKNAGFLTHGSVSVEDMDPSVLSPKERCGLVGMMFQNPELQFCMDTVRNELVFCMENICMDPSEMDAAMEEALSFCNILHLKDRTLLSLSGGERQKVMLACLVLLKPKWLLLDEPFANIDDASARAIAAKLRELNREHGVGILAVDHRLDNWLGAADQIRIMEEGRLRPEIMSVDDPDPELLESCGIIVPGRHYCQSAEIPCIPCEGTPALEFRHLSMGHKNNTILTDVNGTFYKDRIYAIVGESGCGKSSLFGTVSGLYSYKGEILLEGHVYKPGKKADLGKIGFVTQNPQDQFVADTVREEILTGIRKLPDAEKQSEEILRSIKLWRYRDISAYLLSQGQQRRLGVAALMAYDCKVLICDEPTYAQDRRNTMAIMEGLCKLTRDNHMVLIFSTHDRQLASDYADEILELKGGQLHAKD